MSKIGQYFIHLWS